MTPAEEPARGWPRRPLLLMAVCGLALVGWLTSPHLVRFASGAEVVVSDTQSTALPAYEGGIEAVPYSHGAYARLGIPLTNDGSIPVTVTDLVLADRNRPLLEVVEASGLPVTLAPKESAEVVLHARFANCEYYTERALDLYPAATVHFEALGRSGAREIAFERTLAVRSPTIVDCPDRVSDRGAKQRNR